MSFNIVNMDNYEINILRRGGNWKKVKPDDLVLDESNNNQKENEELHSINSNESFLSHINKVNLIVLRLETIEAEKNNLKEDLKKFEVEFLHKKKIAEDKINKMTEEKEMIDKTINIIEKLKRY